MTSLCPIIIRMMKCRGAQVGSHSRGLVSGPSKGRAAMHVLFSSASPGVFNMAGLVNEQSFKLQFGPT